MVRRSEFKYATKSEAKAAFEALLAEKGARSDWTWEQTMKPKQSPDQVTPDKEVQQAQLDSTRKSRRGRPTR